MRSFQVLDHTSEIGILARGDTLAEVFAAAAEGMFSVTADLSTVQELEAVEVEVASSDLEALLVDWLNEVLFQAEVRGMVFRRFEVVQIGETYLRALCHGEPVDADRHRVHGMVKAATYHMVQVARNGEYRARVFFDI